MNNYLSKIDSDRFGFLVAKISGSVENLELVLRELEEMSTKLVIARVDFSNIKLINQLEKSGFRYKDAQITFNFNVKNRLPNRKYNSYSLVSFNKRHLADMVEITRASFNNYGHYFADERLNNQKCIDVYTDWIIRCTENKDVADEIIVAEKDDCAIGYLAIKKHFNDDEKYLSGVIGAVSPEYRKCGVFQSINLESIYLAKNIGADRIENNVLLTNFPVMKSYASLGYNIIRSEITLHYWYE